MRGGRGSYNSRGTNSNRGGYYRNSNSYGNNRNQSNRQGGGRYDNYNGGNHRYHHGGQNTGGSHYDNRQRDKFNNSSGSISGNDRYESGHKRSYDSNRDRHDDRKRPRQEDYRRTTSNNAGRGDRPSSSSSQALVQTSMNYHRNGAGSSNSNNTSTYRQRDETSGNRHHRSSPMGPPKRAPLRAGSSYIARTRGNFSSTRGMRTTVRGIGGSMRIIRTRESTDLKIMRRKLLYAQQKDRARVLKIQRLTSSLRRRRLERQNSKSLSRSQSEKKSHSTEDDDKSAENQIKKTPNDNIGEKSDSEKLKKESPSKRAPKLASVDDDGGEVEGKNEDIQHLAILSNIKKEEFKNLKDVEKTKIGKNDDEDNINDKTKTKNDNNKECSAERSGKNKEIESNEKEKQPKKLNISTSNSVKKDKDEKKINKSKEDDRKDNRTHSNSCARNRVDDHIGTRKRSFIKLTCIHCHIKCVTFKEYSYHLNSRTHKNALRQVALRQRADLLRLRARQRTAQREIEENSKEQYESRYCRLCRLAYRQPKAQHQLSDHHKTIKKFLMPYCSCCHLAFKNSMLYEIHRCSLDHIRNKARNQDSDSDNSADEREIDLNKFLTVDSVGEIDTDTMDADVDALLEESEAAQNAEDGEVKKLSLVGANFIKPIEAFYCELCNHYSAKVGDDTPESYAKKHCLQRAHLKAYLLHKDEEEQASRNSIKKTKVAEINKDNKSQNNSQKIPVEEEPNQEENSGEENRDAEIEFAENDDAANITDETLWEEVDKDLGDLLAEVEPLGRDDYEEDESVLNIDIESEKSKIKDPKEKERNDDKDESEEENSKKDEGIAKDKNSTASSSKSASPITKSKSQRKAVVSLKRTTVAAVKAATKPNLQK